MERLQRDPAADKKAGTAAALAALKTKRAEREAKLRMLAELPLPESPNAADARRDDGLDDWSSDDEDQPSAPLPEPDSPSPKPKPTRRLRKHAPPGPARPPASSLDTDLLSQLDSLSITQPRAAPKPHRPAGPSRSASVDPESASDADSDPESGSDYADDPDGTDANTNAAIGAPTDGALSSPSPAPARPHAPQPAAKPDDLALDIDFTIPSKVAKDLFPYQRDGVRWLHSLLKQRKGGILGDDMGLGKTRQCCAFIAGMFHSRKAKCVLVVAPVTLMAAWAKELGTCGLSHLVVEFHGPTSKGREADLQRAQRSRGIVLTTYGMVLHNQESLRAGSRYQPDNDEDTDEFKWDCMFLDEGHRVKNPRAKQYLALKALPAALRVVVTGTPIQNNLVELHALYNLCNPGLLGELREFKATFERPIEASHARDATKWTRQVGAAKAEELRRIIRPFFLRREKKDVRPSQPAEGGEGSALQPSQLPAKNDLVMWLRLNPLQERIYYAFIKSKAVKEALMNNEHVLASLTALNKICNHPALLSKAAGQHLLQGGHHLAGGRGLSEDSDAESISDSDSDADSLDDFIVDDDDDSDEEGGRRARKGKSKGRQAKSKTKAAGNSKSLQKAAEQEDAELNMEELWGEGCMQDLESQLVEDMQQQGWEASCKTSFVRELLRNLKAGGHRVLVFGRSLMMLKTVQAACEMDGIKTIYMAGEINGKKRAPIVERFKRDTSITVFLLTTEVGGVGLTITEADRVIIMDPSWNPSKDAQAVDRAYRIGQTKPVVVYRLITCGTIEEKMYRRQVFKGGLSRSGTEEGVQTRYFSPTELHDLLAVDPIALRESATQKQLNEMHAHQRDYSPELEAHLQDVLQMPRCTGAHDHSLLFSEKPPEEAPLSPAALAALEAQEKAARSRFGAGAHRQPANDGGLSDLMAEALQLGDAAGSGGARVLGREVAPQGLAVAIQEEEDKLAALRAAIARSERTLALPLPDSGVKVRDLLKQQRQQLATAEADLAALRAQRSSGLLSQPPAPPTAAPASIPEFSFYPAAAPAAAATAAFRGHTMGQASAGSFAGPLLSQVPQAPASAAFGLRPLGQAGKTSPAGTGATGSAARSAAAAAPVPRPATLTANGRLADITNHAPAASAAAALKKPSPAARHPAAAKASPAAPSELDDADADEIVHLAPRRTAKAPAAVVDLTED